MKTIRVFLAALLLLCTAQAIAQGAGLDDPKSHRQVFAMGLYPPDVIMRYQQALGITDTQRGNMLKLVKGFQSEIAELQWNLQNEQQQMRQALAGNTVDQEKVMPQVQRVLQMESEFKTAHFRLLIGIKNELTDEQINMIQQRLREKRQ